MGWRLDADFAAGDDFRLIQFTPPGSGCSVIFGKNVTAAAQPARSLYLIVADIEAARAELLDRGVEAARRSTTLATRTPAQTSRTCLTDQGRCGPDPEHRSYRSFAFVQRCRRQRLAASGITARLPGRVDTHGTTFTSSTELAIALRRAAAAHGEHEKRSGQRDENWPDWYAEYIVREQAGKELST